LTGRTSIMDSNLTGHWELVLLLTHDGRSLPNGVAGGQAANVAGFLPASCRLLKDAGKLFGKGPELIRCLMAKRRPERQSL